MKKRLLTTATLAVASLAAAGLASLGGVANADNNVVEKPTPKVCDPTYQWRDVERKNKPGFTGGRVMQITAALQVQYSCSVAQYVRAYNAVDCEYPDGTPHNCSFSNEMRHYVDGITLSQLNDSGTSGTDGFWSRYTAWEPVGRCNEYEARAETWDAGLASQYSNNHYWTWSFNADGSAWSYCPA